MVLVFGLLSLIPGWGFLFGPLGWWFGRRELRGIAAGLRRPSGRKRARVGYITGIVGTVLSVVVVGVMAVTAPPQESIDAAQREYDEQVSVLDRAVSEVSIPAEWEVSPSNWSSFAGSVGYRASPDLSSSGTWLNLAVAPAAASGEGESSEDAFWQMIATLEGDTGGALVDDPLPATVSGLDGYLYEVSGLLGEKTGQELGAYAAVFFGPAYTYEVMLQFEIADRDEMSVLYRDTVVNLTLVEDAGLL